MSEDELKNLEQKAEVRLNGWMSEKGADRRKNMTKQEFQTNCLTVDHFFSSTFKGFQFGRRDFVG